ncbi:hypothetical protein JCM31826_14800 [Thermaurantimonas aggregans]|uniref:CRISPR system single-strand-specific deoxyribonuclease Cas10/Csm1 (subtype III-A) n=1 Tax=Thermaurantimonas aggregans TaxID=2173829 RepID=A0A401XLX8_9FLAO|nr:type III-A CRISPR-associated protein Cas10/Csm1 [Thermaurantimonas aggregans]GCD77998.1 hypothetical protein JCM31826_14800 [Thermaurantimonas aggregans]
MKNATDRDIVYLAALLHDIGKFFQRADPDGMKTTRLLEPEIRKLESVYCPNQGNYYSHLHVLWTAQFIKNNNLEFTVDDLNLMRLACAHHKPGKIDEQLIALADKLSSGMDRIKSNSINENDDNTQKSFKKVRLHNVMEYVSRPDDYSGIHRFDIQPFEYNSALDASAVKELSFSNDKDSFTNDPKYSEVWQAFSRDIKSIDTKSDLKTWIESFTYVLEKHARFIPSSTVDLPDVSLYDHLRTSAGLAISLYDYLIENYKSINEPNVKLPDIDTPFALLIGADLSGIQSFIYNISSKNAAKSLKGRSFYLQWLIDNVLYCFLKKTGLYRGNVIIDSGGGFHVLAPNTAQVRQTVDELRTTINEWLFNNFGTRLFISIDYIEITSKNLLQQEDISIPSLADKWTELHKKLERHKVQRYDKMFISEDAYPKFFEPGIAPKFDDIDDISGDIIEPENKIGKNRSRQSQLQIELGRQLKNSAGLIVAEDIGINSQEKFFEFDFQCAYTKKGVLIEKRNEKYYYKGNHVENGRSLLFNATDFLVPLFSERNVIKGFTFYGGNTYPADEDGEPKTFDELAGEGDFKRLGILRMDVDNLGALFKNGFSRKKHSISRLATLSRSLDFFFKGYLNNLVGTHKSDCYILYSGGDDLFLLGKWDVILEIAEIIRNDFREYTAYNPNLSISGGIVFVKGKFPAKRFAKLAENEEKNAKSHKVSNGEISLEKNSLSVFGFALNWDTEWPMVKHLYKTIYSKLMNGELNKSFISRVLTFYEYRKLTPDNVSWRWLLAYTFGRMIERDKNQREFLQAFHTSAFTDSYIKFGDYSIFLNGISTNQAGEKLISGSGNSFLDLAAVACRLAEFKWRSLT